MQVYLVGGAVRDKLLNLKVKDKDWVVVGATPKQMLDLGYQQVGKDFPVFLHPKSKQEYALARTERKIAGGYTGFECQFGTDVSLEQDLIRRDLTINAIAEDDNGQLIDPHNGLADIQAKLLRHVSPAFVEDPLRVLRVARFAARYHSLGFTIAAETIELMQQMVNHGELNHLQPERIWLETEKALMTGAPQIYFKILKQVGALKVIMPELDCLWGIPNPEKWHPEIDTGIHCMMVVEQASKLSESTEVRFAALCHDLGKGLTPPEMWPRHHGHEKAGVQLVKDVCSRLRIPNHFRDLACITSEFHCHIHKAYELKSTTYLKMFDKTDLWRKPERFKQFLLCCLADFKGRKDFENRDYPQFEHVRKIADACLSIKAQPFLQQGYKGLQIKQKIYDERIKVIKQLSPAPN
ncbi:metal dependent phosphohydrolase [Catenovulum agarivorans DS-2]|uniref:Multifunctional CCA protein n=1 Tax=Catenovulum agarivorans DS-2 TaxID=1328313 RepID=W7QCJ8_9ALTE|nr:multifunctional CCA addition/repair protein [Catenovulum agarivorans]EWH09626.1 metal dependent phosphohydrolase [Catenovulum agarivorans DS-2]